MRRRSLGSPNPGEVRRMIEDRREQLCGYRESLGERRGAVEASRERLRTTIEEYLAE